MERFPRRFGYNLLSFFLFQIAELEQDCNNFIF